MSDHSGELDGLPVFWRDATPPSDASGGAVPLYVHGVPSNCDEWTGFLSSGGGLCTSVGRAICIGRVGNRVI